jgi:hypothetical protein
VTDRGKQLTAATLPLAKLCGAVTHLRWVLCPRRMERTETMHRTINRVGRLALPALVLLGLPLAAQSVSQADTISVGYTSRAIAKLGEPVGNVALPATSSYRIFAGPLSDTGQIAFGVGTALQDVFYMGPYLGNKPGLLFQYADGQLTPIAMAGTEGPAGTWPADVTFLWPFGMNQGGNIVFAAATKGGSKVLGTFLWDAKARKVIPLALGGMPAVHNMTFSDAGGFGSAINNRNEIALVASVKNPAGPSGPGLFFLERNGTLLPVLLPDQPLPGGGRVRSSIFPGPSINDAGAIAFLARRQGDTQNSAYVWQETAILPALTVGTEVPGGKITSVSSAYVNNKNHNVIVTAAVGGTTRHGVYRVANGTITPLAVPGQPMPGGGKWKTLQNVLSASAGYYSAGTFCLGCSVPNEAGEHVLLATLEDNSTAAYRMTANGTLSLILKSGTDYLNLGMVTRVGVDSPASLNSKGQIALSVRINGGAPTLILLTPPSS